MFYHSAALIQGHAPIRPAHVQWIEHDATGIINSVARLIERRALFLQEYGDDHPMAQYYLSPVTLCVMDRDDSLSDQEWAWSVIHQTGHLVNVAVRAIDRRPFDTWLKKIRFGIDDLSFREVEDRLIAARIKWAGLKERTPFHQGDIDRAGELVEMLKAARRAKHHKTVADYTVLPPTE